MFKVYQTLLREGAPSFFGEPCERNYSGFSGFVGEYPGRVSFDFFFIADPKAPFSVRRGALFVWKKIRGFPEHRFLLLAIRTPEGSVENGTLVIKAHREVVVFPGLRRFFNKIITACDNRDSHNRPYNYFLCFIIFHMRWG